MTPDTSLTIAVLAWRESEHLEACFASVASLRAQTGASTLVVLNQDSDAVTREIAHRVAEQVVDFPFVNFSIQRNRALDAATTEWVFFIDADERCTSQLADELARVITHKEHDAYRVPRRNILFGHEVKHTGWWPDYQIRLLRRAACHYDETVQVHEVPQVAGAIGTLNMPLVHYNYKNWSQFVSKQRSYAKLDARAKWDSGFRARPRSLLGQPLRELKRRLVEYEGYKDGLLGVALSLAMSLYALEVQRQLFLLQRQRGA